MLLSFWNFKLNLDRVRFWHFYSFFILFSIAKADFTFLTDFCIWKSFLWKRKKTATNNNCTYILVIYEWYTNIQNTRGVVLLVFSLFFFFWSPFPYSFTFFVFRSFFFFCCFCCWFNNYMKNKMFILSPSTCVQIMIFECFWLLHEHTHTQYFGFYFE